MTINEQHFLDLRDGSPAAQLTEFLPFARPSIGDDEIENAVASLRSGWLTTGPKVAEFEASVANFVKASHAAAVSSCTAGLHLSLIALGVGPGDEVIVPTLTFCSTANVVEHLGAKPVLVDVQEDFNIDVEGVARAITSRTRAIIPVHFSGLAVDLAAIYELARAHGLAVVEDAAHAIGASHCGHSVGSDSAVANFPGVRRTVVFSFYATKNMTTGEGGMVVTADKDIADRIRVLSLHGMSRDAWKRYSSVGSWFYEVVAAGFKANMTDVEAAIGLVQLSRLESFTDQRRTQARLYDAMFDQVAGVQTPIVDDANAHAFHLYVLRVSNGVSADPRNRLIEELRERNIGTSVHFIPVHTHPFYRDKYGFTDADFPVASKLFRQIVSIPLYPSLSPTEQRFVADAVGDILEKMSTAAVH